MTRSSLAWTTPDRIFAVAAACALAGAGVVAAARWTAQPSGVDASLRGVSVVDDHTAFVSGSNGTLLRTTDGGATWQPRLVSGDTLDLRDVDAIDDAVVYALSIGTGVASRIYKSTDAGARWILQYANQDPKGFLDAMAFWDEAHGIVVGDSIDGRFSILLTGDGGHTWTPAPPAGLPPALPNEGAFAASGTNVAVFGTRHAWIGTGAADTARVLRTADGGATWAVADSPLPAGPSSGIFSIAFRDARHGVIVGGDYSKEHDAVDNVAVTSDGGQTWTLVRERGLSGFRSVVAYVPGTPASVIAVGPQGADWSDDDGRSWTPIEGGGFHTFAFSKTGARGWGAGANGRIGRLDVRP